MARSRIRLAHDREILRLKTTRTQSRIAIQDHREKIAQIDAKLAQLKPPKPPAGA